jgi:hypothetical protein
MTLGQCRAVETHLRWQLTPATMAALERGSTVIRLYDMNRHLADIEMIDGVMCVVSYNGDWVERSLESVRKCNSPRNGPLLTDREFYDILPTRLCGHVRAVRV